MDEWVTEFQTLSPENSLLSQRRFLLRDLVLYLETTCAVSELNYIFCKAIQFARLLTNIDIFQGCIQSRRDVVFARKYLNSNSEVSSV